MRKLRTLKEMKVSVIQRIWSHRFLHTFPEVVDHLMVLTQAGIPLREALYLVKEISVRRGQQADITALVAAVERGESLSNVWGQKTPGPLRVMMEAGGQTGNLVVAMSLWAKQVNNQQQWHNQVIRIITYPALLFMTVVGVLMFIDTHVLPQFESLYHQLGVNVPRSMHWFLHVLHVGPWFISACMIILSLAMTFVKRTNPPDSRHRPIWTPIMTPVWQIKRIARTRVLAQLLGMLILGGVPIVQSLDLLENESDEPWMRQNARDIRQNILGGIALTDAFAGPWDPILTAYLRQAEGTGDLGAALMKVAEYTERRLRVLTQIWVGWLEPTLIVVLGMVVAGTMAVLFIPMYTLAGQVGQTGPL